MTAHPGWKITGSLAFVSFLRRCGDPSALEEAAERLERFPGEDERGAAARLRDIAAAARAMLATLEEGGIVFDFATGEAKVRTDRRGPNVALLTVAVVQAFNDLGFSAREPWTADTFQAIREALREWVSKEELESLTDRNIRSRIEDWSRLLRR